MSQSHTPYSETEVLQLVCQAYQTGCAIFTVDLRRAALLLIDMQLEFVLPGWVPEATRLAGLLALARRAGLPIIHTAFAATHACLDRPASGAFMPNRYPAQLACSSRRN